MELKMEPIYQEAKEQQEDIVGKILNFLEQTYFGFAKDTTDGLSLESPQGDWRFNIRPSNTETLVRLNVEARTPEMMHEKTSEILEHVLAVSGQAGKNATIEGLDNSLKK